VFINAASLRSFAIRSGDMVDFLKQPPFAGKNHSTPLADHSMKFKQFETLLKDYTY
jgi:hypothetical protein